MLELDMRYILKIFLLKIIPNAKLLVSIDEALKNPNSVCSLKVKTDLNGELK